MQNKINFTAEHQKRLDELTLKFLKRGQIFKGNIGTELNVYNLYHTCSLKQLEQIHKYYKKLVDESSGDDGWTKSDYEQRKQRANEECKEFLHLLVGYTKYNSEKGEAAKQLRNLKDKYKELKESSKTPEEQLKDLEAQIKSFGEIEEEVE